MSTSLPRNLSRFVLFVASWCPLLLARADWPTFRGNAALHGVAAGSLPDQPEVLWTFDAGSPVKSAPVVKDGLVVFGSEDGVIHAIGAADGAPRWKVATSNVIESAALFLNDSVYVTDNGGFIYALNPKDGSERWRFETEGEIPGGCNAFAQDGVWKLLVGSYDYRLWCLDAATGKSNWVYETENYINGVPAIENGLTCFGGCDAKAHVVDVNTGLRKHGVELGSYIAGSGALENGRLYVGHYGNRFLCVDVNKGAVVWEYQFREFPFFAAPALAAETVIAAGRDKHVHAINKKTGKMVWRYRAGGKIDSSPVICGDKVVFGADDGRVTMIRLADGSEVWSHDLGKPITASAAVSDGRFLIADTGGKITCFGTKTAP